ncbi:penicillin-binding protein [Pseudonocardia sp. RS11V-5]|uniref:transglycosylase domain-containing protein n=1 Tax=Pseudonocardia terrae TaxID=2905831 RepID=UPI001E5ECE60|nr:transglycosylase domain-containing protein [Pseudonocardia terrae]MCE3549861.1 penicillin-binding protein [Pseudonocardia terrae]
MIGGVVLAGLLAPVALGVDLVARVTAPPTATLPSVGAMPAATTVLDRNGAPLAMLYDQYREPLTYSQISPSMTAAAVAIEDRRFFDEGGVDPLGTVRALFSDAAGNSVQGGSTITQQYVKNYLINVADRNDPGAQQADRADTVGRKIREAALATRLAKGTSKQDVLAGYLDVVEFGGNVYGVGAAARAYFGTSAATLTVPQAALLAGMVNNPNLYDPYRHPQAALDRRNLVIGAMQQVGSITPAQAAAATAAPLGVVPNGPVIPGGTCMAAAPDAGFFCQYVVSYLEQAGFTADQLLTGGYTIRTTMDPTVGAAAKAAVDANVPTTQDGVADTFALVRPGHDGHEVLAVVANRDYGTDAAKGQTSTNIVADPSNVFGAGSSYKIFTTAAALETGTVGYDTPLTNPGSDCFTPPNANRWTSCYPVANDGTNYPNPISLQDALATSPNVAFVGLEARTGMPAVLQMAQRLGLRRTLTTNDAGSAPITDPADPRSRDPRYDQPQSQYFQNLLSFTLGDSPVSTLEMANVAATIQSDGVWCPPSPIRSVTDRNGKPVAVSQEACQQVVAPGLAHTLAAGLSKDTVTGTSAAAARAAGWTRPDIGKTGTTNTSESVAFVGGVGGITGFAGSSMVFADGPHPQEICPGNPVHLGDCGHGAFGGTVAAPPWFATMNQLLDGAPDVPVPGPDPAYLQPGSHPTVPYTVGRTQAAATTALQQAGYAPSTTSVASALPAGQVVGQTPQGNADPGTPVTLLVSSGALD